MISAWFLIFLFTHWVADFVFQTRWQAENKSKDLVALTNHVFVYTAILFIPAVFALPTKAVLLFVLANGFLHWCTDYVTSRITSKLYAKKDYHNFFVVVGFDQLIHQMTIAVTLLLLSSKFYV